MTATRIWRVYGGRWPDRIACRKGKQGAHPRAMLIRAGAVTSNGEDDKEEQENEWGLY